MRKGESKSSNRDEPTDRGTAGPGGRMEKHVRVSSVSGRTCGLGLGEDIRDKDTRRAALSWVLPGGRGALSLQLLRPVLPASLYYFTTK